MLDARGYQQCDWTHAMLADAPKQVARDDTVVMETFSSELRFDGLCGNSSVGLENRQTLSAMLELVEGNVCYASIIEAGLPVAFGMSVVDDRCAGFLEIFVSPGHRGVGLGRRIMKTLFAWACQDMGAEEIWLQLVADNAPAVALYGSFDLQPIYVYHYRIRPE